jgi:hypothetical protein
MRLAHVHVDQAQQKHILIGEASARPGHVDMIDAAVQQPQLHLDHGPLRHPGHTLLGQPAFLDDLRVKIAQGNAGILQHLQRYGILQDDLANIEGVDDDPHRQRIDDGLAEVLGFDQGQGFLPQWPDDELVEVDGGSPDEDQCEQGPECARDEIAVQTFEYVSPVEGIDDISARPLDWLGDEKAAVFVEVTHCSAKGNNLHCMQAHLARQRGLIGGGRLCENGAIALAIQDKHPGEFSLRRKNSTNWSRGTENTTVATSPA